MKRIIAALLIAVAVAVLIGYQHHKATKALAIAQSEKRHEAIRKLALDDLRRDCDDMRAKLNASHDPSSIGMGLQVMSYEMNVRSAIQGTLDQDANEKLSLELQGPLSQEVKLRVMANAAERLKKAEQTYNAALELQHAAN